MILIFISLGYSPFFFLFFMLISRFVIINMFILIIIKQFEEFHKNSDQPILVFNDNLFLFNEKWNEFTHETKRDLIHCADIFRFLRYLGEPLG